MKKKFLILGVLVLAPFMTACGGSSNQLACTRDSSAGVEGYYFDFDNNNKLTGGHVEEEIVYETASCGEEEECKEFINDAVDGCKASSDYSGCKISKQDSKGATIVADFEKSALDDAGIPVGTEKTDVKEKAESYGFKCK